MKKGIPSMGIRAILSIAAFFAVISLTGKTAYAEDYNLWVGNTQVTSSNLSGNCNEGGTWSYSGNSTSGNLTLNNAVITNWHEDWKRLIKSLKAMIYPDIIIILIKL